MCAWLWESSSGKRDHGGDKRDNCRSRALEKTEEWGPNCMWRVWLSYRQVSLVHVSLHHATPTSRPLNVTLHLPCAYSLDTLLLSPKMIHLCLSPHFPIKLSYLPDGSLSWAPLQLPYSWKSALPAFSSKQLPSAARRDCPKPAVREIRRLLLSHHDTSL